MFAGQRLTIYHCATQPSGTYMNAKTGAHRPVGVYSLESAAHSQ